MCFDNFVLDYLYFHIFCFDHFAVTTFNELVDSPLACTVGPVHGPGGESIARNPLMLPINSFSTHYIILDVIVLEISAGDTTGPSFPRGRAPEQVANLEQPMVSTSVPVEVSYSRSIELRLVLSNAHPRRYLVLWDAVDFPQFSRQFAPLIHFAMSSLR
jgi:hypothetical protein